MNINQNISRKIASWCQRTLEIDELEKAVMEYGISLFLSSVGKFIMLTTLGYILGVGTETIVVLVVFASVRIFANGIHMKSRLGCTAMMAKCVNEMSKKLAEAEQVKSSPFWTYEEPVPKEVKLWLELEKNAIN